MQGVVSKDILFPDGCLVLLELDSKRKGVYQDLRVKVLGECVAARRDGRLYTWLRPHICKETHKNTGAGLLQCLLFARQTLH